MDDTLSCPICGNKFRNIKRSSVPHTVERTCSGTNHVVQMYVNEYDQKVLELKFSLDPRYSKHLNINYQSQTSQIVCMKNSNPFYIDLPEVLEVDFPDLTKIKKKVDLYILIS